MITLDQIEAEIRTEICKQIITKWDGLMRSLPLGQVKKKSCFSSKKMYTIKITFLHKNHVKYLFEHSIHWLNEWIQNKWLLTHDSEHKYQYRVYKTLQGEVLFRAIEI